MSRYARDGRNANAAICVSVHPSDYGSTPENAIAYQRNLEKTAYSAGGCDYAAPCQLVGDFLSGKMGTEPGRIQPSYRDGKVKMVDLHTILPPYIHEMLAEGMRRFDRQIPGFAAADVPIILIEGDAVNAAALGELFYFFELSNAIFACACGMDPFDLPAELPVRRAAAALLGRPEPSEKS